jgi:RNA polymerase sigma-70 factor (ECF subfamily)
MTSRANLSDIKKLFVLWNLHADLLSNDSISTKKTIRQGKAQSQHSDEELVAASQGGDTKAFELLILRYQRQIFNLIYQMTHDAEVVEDIGQDIFVAAFKAIEGFQSKSSFFTWLYRIAINHCKNYLASSNRAQDFEARYQVEQDIDEGSDDYEKDPANRLLAKEFAEQFEGALALLPPEQRIVLTLCEFQGLSYQEISEILDCPIGTVRSRLSRARTTLQDVLGTHL